MNLVQHLSDIKLVARRKAKVGVSSSGLVWGTFSELQKYVVQNRSLLVDDIETFGGSILNEVVVGDEVTRVFVYEIAGSGEDFYVVLGIRKGLLVNGNESYDSEVVGNRVNHVETDDEFYDFERLLISTWQGSLDTLLGVR